MKRVPLIIAMASLGAVAAFLVYDFSSHIFPMWVSVASAGALFTVYVGLAYTALEGSKRDMGMAVAGVAMLIEMLYGTLAALARIEPTWFEGPFPLWASLLLAVLHGAPFTLLLFGVSMLVLHQDTRTAQPEPAPQYAVQTPTQVPVLEGQSTQEQIQAALCQCGGDVQAAAALLGHRTAVDMARETGVARTRLYEWAKPYKNGHKV